MNTSPRTGVRGWGLSRRRRIYAMGAALAALTGAVFILLPHQQATYPEAGHAGAMHGSVPGVLTDTDSTLTYNLVDLETGNCLEGSTVGKTSTVSCDSPFLLWQIFVVGSDGNNVLSIIYNLENQDCLESTGTDPAIPNAVTVGSCDPSSVSSGGLWIIQPVSGPDNVIKVQNALTDNFLDSDFSGSTYAQGGNPGPFQQWTMQSANAP